MNFLSIMKFQLLFVATKADKIPCGKWNKHESIIKKKLNFDKNDHFIVFSSVTRDGYDEAWDTICQNCKKSSEKSEVFFLVVIVFSYLFDSFHLLSKGMIL